MRVWERLPARRDAVRLHSQLALQRARASPQLQRRPRRAPSQRRGHRRPSELRAAEQVQAVSRAPHTPRVV